MMRQCDSCTTLTQPHGHGDESGTADDGHDVHLILPRALSTAFHNYGDVFGRRGARIARREEEECREHVTDEQRREAGCIGGRMSP